MGDKNNKLLFNYEAHNNVEFMACIRKDNCKDKAMYSYIRILENEISRKNLLNKDKKIYYTKALLSYIMSQLDLDTINVYMDPTLPNKNVNCYYFENYGVFFPKEFFEFDYNITNIVRLFAHELKHAKVYDSNEKFERRVNEKPFGFVPSFNSENLKYLGFSKENDLYVLYKIQQNERSAIKFSFEFMINFLKDIRVAVKNDPILLKLINEEEKRIHNMALADSNFCTKAEQIFYPQFKLKLTESRNKLMNKIKIGIDDLVNTNPVSIFSSEKFNLLSKDISNFLISFENYPNDITYNSFKSYIEKNYQKHPIYIFIYSRCLNLKTHKITETEVKNYYEMKKFYQSPIYFEELNAKYEDLVSIYCDKYLTEKNTKMIMRFLRANQIKPENSIELESRVKYNTYLN